MDRYTAQVGYHIKNRYITEIFLLDVVVTNTEFGGFVLTRVSDCFKIVGTTREEFDEQMNRFCSDFQLETRTPNAKDVLLIYVDDLDKIRAFFYDYVTNDLKKSIQCGNIEFRSWKEFTKEGPIEVMQDWSDRFMEDKFPYLTPSQYPRKRMKKIAKGKASNVFPETLPGLFTVYKAVHGGVLYSRPEEGIIEDLLGFDICSAYIHSLIFKKHASTELSVTDPKLWEDYVKTEDKGSIGVYRITYNSIFRVVSCFKDTMGRHLQPGTHTVEIALSNVDLKSLIECLTPGVMSIDCVVLYTFKMDYLPEEFRLYCAREFLKKQTLPKDSAAYRNQKVILNGGFFGNLLYEANSILSYTPPEDQKNALKKAVKEAATAPQWGVFTMAHAKAAVYSIGLKVSGWHYSDTDSVYCDNDTYNLRVVNQFNAAVKEENIILCDFLGYNKEFGDDVKYLYDLGTFKLEAKIKRFRSWGYKLYAYETIEGEVVQKAAGCLKEKLTTDSEVIFSESYRPSGAADQILVTPGHYYVLKHAER